MDAYEGYALSKGISPGGDKLTRHDIEELRGMMEAEERRMETRV